MREPIMLSRVADSTPPIAVDALQEFGNKLVTRARVEALTAIRASLITEFVERGRSVQPRDLKRWRHQAREAAKAWQAVVATMTELLNELEKQHSRPTDGEGQ